MLMIYMPRHVELYKLCLTKASEWSFLQLHPLTRTLGHKAACFMLSLPRAYAPHKDLLQHSLLEELQYSLIMKLSDLPPFCLSYNLREAACPIHVVLGL